jgi:hypothetical protein
VELPLVSHPGHRRAQRSALGVPGFPPSLRAVGLISQPLGHLAQPAPDRVVMAHAPQRR